MFKFLTCEWLLLLLLLHVCAKYFNAKRTQTLTGPKWRLTLMNTTVSPPTRRSSIARTPSSSWPGDYELTQTHLDARLWFQLCRALTCCCLCAGLWCRVWTWWTRGHSTCRTGTSGFLLLPLKLLFRPSLWSSSLQSKQVAHSQPIRGRHRICANFL